MKNDKIVRLITLAFAAQIALSWPLWCPVARTFPMLPIVDFWPLQDAWWSYLQVAGLLAALSALFIFPQKKWSYYLFVVWLSLLIVLDINRLQVWVWFYGLSLGILFPAGQGRAAERQTADADAALVALRCLLAAVYCWSGFNKLTPFFAEDQFPWFCGAFSFLRFLRCVLKKRKLNDGGKIDTLWENFRFINDPKRS